MTYMGTFTDLLLCTNNFLLPWINLRIKIEYLQLFTAIGR